MGSNVVKFRKKTQPHPYLPSWVMRDTALRRACFDLEPLGWTLHELVIGPVRQMLFSNPDVCPVPARYLRADEALAAQAEMNRCRA